MIRSLTSLLSQFIPLIITFLLAAASYWLAISGQSGWFGSTAPVTEKTIDSYVTGFKIQNKRFSNQSVSLMFGVSADHHPKDNVWIIDQPKVQQFELSGNQANSVAKQAYYYPGKDLVTLENQVKLDSESGGVNTHIETSELNFDIANSEIRTEAPIEGTRPGQQFKAVGVVINQKTGQLETLGKTHIQIEAKP